MRDRHLTDEEDKAMRDGNRDLQMRAGARDAAWQDVVAAVDAVAVADREADSQAYRCGVLVRLGAPRSLTDRFMEPFSRRLEDAIQSGTVGPFDGWQPTPLVSAFPPRGMPNSEARKRVEEGRPAPGGEPLRVGYGHHPASICVRCGIPGGNAQICWPKGEPVCCSAEDCDARVALAKVCLELVPRSLGDVYRFRKRLRGASHALTQV